MVPQLAAQTIHSSQPVGTTAPFQPLQSVHNSFIPTAPRFDKQAMALQLSNDEHLWLKPSPVQMLTEDQREKTLTFLLRRPVHTVCMVGLIRDNGMVNDLNRGVFYGYWNEQKVLEGVALIGHSTLIEALTERAFKALANPAC